MNEIIRANFSTQMWGYFKVPGTPILTFLFALSQVPLMMRHSLEEPGKTDGTP